MAGTFIIGETKIRPGTYFNIQKVGGNQLAGADDGTTAVFFKADFGPMNEVVEIAPGDGYEKYSVQQEQRMPFVKFWRQG